MSVHHMGNIDCSSIWWKLHRYAEKYAVPVDLIYFNADNSTALPVLQ